jgi:hypothetical protein
MPRREALAPHFQHGGNVAALFAALGLLAIERAFAGRRGDDRIGEANRGIGDGSEHRANQRRDDEQP